MESSIVLGVDIGGSHITTALVNLETKSIISSSKVRKHVNAKGSAHEIIGYWVNAIKASFDTIALSQWKLGIAMPGPFDYEEGVSLMRNQEKYDSLHGLNIKNILSDELGVPTSCFQFVNDAECFLKGEVFSGAAKGVSKAVGLTLGTGLGSSRFKEGKVTDADLWCSPFQESIAEEYLSTRWFTKRYTALTGRPINDVKEIIELPASGDIKEQLFYEFGKNLAAFFNTTMACDEPEVIVLGGNIANAYNQFKGALEQNLSAAFLTTRVCTTQLGEDASLVGAASIWSPVPAAVVQV